ncbi:MAG: M23 family metallopeptidase [Magnetospirillum sp.]|nr:M23 family metallopeptidase [Magnetospirillum sp.]
MYRIVGLGLAFALISVSVAAEPTACTIETERLRQALAERDRSLDLMAERLAGLARGNIRAIEKALAGTGISPDRLVRRAPKRRAEGGPFVPAGSALAAAMGEVERWNRLERAVRVLPWGPPLARYHLTSGFGPRRDPFNHRRAFHTGIDLKAAARAAVRATAPGRVVFAGRRGGYGRMVEVDHGFGVRTRYGHLAALRVHRGQRVADGQLVGLVGSSGRSTGVHMHYEVVVGGIPRNPMRFMRRGPR